jgi:flagellar basal-body rod modification protein FlgD
VIDSSTRVSGVTSGAGIGSTTGPTRESGLGQDAFMKLLTTQLRYQDPTKPQNDSEFIAQLAQFSSLEKLTQIAQSLETLTQLVLAQQMTTTTNTQNGGI